MTILGYYILYSIIMTPIYQIFIWKNILKERPNKIYFKDVLVSLPFGFVVTLACLCVYSNKNSKLRFINFTLFKLSIYFMCMICNSIMINTILDDFKIILLPVLLSFVFILLYFYSRILETVTSLIEFNNET